MVEKGRISPRQLFSLLVLTRLLFVCLHFPEINYISPGRAVWMAEAAGTVLSVPPVLVVAGLGAKWLRSGVSGHDRSFIVRLPEKIIALALLPSWFLALVAGLRSIGDVYSSTVMFRTPLLVFVAMSGFLAANTARSGLEVIARVSETVVYVMIMCLVVTTALLYRELDPENLLPFPRSPASLAGPSLTTACFSLGCATPVVLAIPCLDRPGVTRRAFVGGLLAAGLATAACSLVLVAVFGPFAGSLAFPGYSLARLLSIGEFLERLEAIPLALWTAGGTLSLAFLAWACAVAIAELLGLETYQSLVYPVVGTAIPCAVLFFENPWDVNAFVSQVWAPYSLVSGLAAVVLAYGGKFLSRRQGVRQCDFSQAAHGRCDRNSRPSGYDGLLGQRGDRESGLRNRPRN